MLRPHLIRRLLSFPRLSKRNMPRWSIAVGTVWVLASICFLSSLQSSSVPSVQSWYRAAAPLGQNSTLDLYREFYYGSEFKYSTPYTLQKNLLTIPFGPGRGERVGTVDKVRLYNWDPRLIWSVLLEYIIQDAADESMEVPFSWYDWADFKEYNKLAFITANDICTMQILLSVSL